VSLVWGLMYRNAGGRRVVGWWGKGGESYRTSFCYSCNLLLRLATRGFKGYDALVINQFVEAVRYEQ